jgi:IS5 family transposase
MLRIHLMQQGFGLSDVAMEEALYDVPRYRQFAGLGGMSRLPDRVSILRFRPLLERHPLAEPFVRTVNAQLSAKGYWLKEGTAVDATLIALIAAPSSTKNQSGERNPEMHPTKKGQQWHFGMKAPIGVDADSGRALDRGTLVGKLADELERVKARIRAKAEHPFRVIKRKRPAKSGVSSIRGQVVPSYAEAIRRSYRPAVLAAA